MSKTALITGATAGIGLATAELFAQNGWNLIITGRRKDRLDSVLVEYEKDISIHRINFDVRDLEGVNSCVKYIEDNGILVDLLVNNAGLALGLESFDEANINDWETMIDTNIKGLLYMSRALSRHMIEHGIPGHLIHVGSLAGHEVYPRGHVYCSTKHAVKALARGMRMDLYEHGIRVGSVDPGMVETEFSQVRFHGDSEKAEKVYKGFQPLEAIDVADVIYFMATRPAHVNIDDVLMMCSDQASSVHVNRRNG